MVMEWRHEISPLRALLRLGFTERIRGGSLAKPYQVKQVGKMPIRYRLVDID